MSELKKQTYDLLSLCASEANAGRIVISGHDLPDADSIISSVMMKKLLEKFNIPCMIKFGTRPDNVTLRDMDKLKLLQHISFDGFEDNDRLLLVDHHRSFYSITSFACVDHHTTPPEPEFDVSIVRKASSCGKVIFDMAKECNIEDEELEILAIYSVYLDTQSCQSPKFKADDIPWLEAGIEKYGINRDDIIRMGYALCDSNEDIEVLAMYGYKKYSYGGASSFSTCIQIDTSDPLWGDVIERIIKHLKKKITYENGAVWAFVVNMPMERKSDIYFIYSEGAMKKVELDRLASRSRDVIPVISAMT